MGIYLSGLDVRLFAGLTEGGFASLIGRLSRESSIGGLFAGLTGGGHSLRS